VIGAGLFVGSGAVTNQTGPAAILSSLPRGRRARGADHADARRDGRREPASPTSRRTATSSRGRITVLSGIVVVIFAFVGAEIVTIAAAESDEPERAVAKATNAVIYRVLVFYVVAVFVVVAIVPWNDTQRALFC
jgi:L-asparagine transporter-like permease